jgi:hypothetical protein
MIQGWAWLGGGNTEKTEILALAGGGRSEECGAGTEEGRMLQEERPAVRLAALLYPVIRTLPRVSVTTRTSYIGYLR